MKLSFDITTEDMMAFNRYRYDTNREVARRIRLRRFLWPAVFVLMGFVLRDRYGIVWGYFGVVSLLWVVFYPRYARRRWETNLERKLARPDNAGLFGRRGMEIDGERVRTVFDHGEETVLWSAFIGSAQSDTHFFLFQTPHQALIIPKRALTAAQSDELSQLLIGRIDR